MGGLLRQRRQTGKLMSEQPTLFPDAPEAVSEAPESTLADSFPEEMRSLPDSVLRRIQSSDEITVIHIFLDGWVDRGSHPLDSFGDKVIATRGVGGHWEASVENYERHRRWSIGPNWLLFGANGRQVGSG